MKTILVFLVSWLCIPFVFGQTMPTVTKLPEFNNPLAALPIMADQASDYVVKYQYRITGFSASIARRRVEYAKITVVNTATGVTEVSFMYLPHSFLNRDENSRLVARSSQLEKNLLRYNDL